MPEIAIIGEREATDQATIHRKPLSVVEEGVWLTPTRLEKVSSDFAPTQKSQSGEFSGSLQTARQLPRYNALKIDERLRESQTICIGVRNPYALLNIHRHRRGDPMLPWHEMKSAQQRITALMSEYLCKSRSGETITYDQLFDPAYGSRLYHPDTLHKYHRIKCRKIGAGAVPSGTTCPQATNWVVSDLNWTYDQNSPSFDSPHQGYADDCWFIAALSSIAWTQPEILTATNDDGIFILDFTSTLTGQALLDASYITPDGRLPAPSVHSPSFTWSHSKSPRLERWVAMMEKALAMRYQGINNNQPNICAIPTGSPQFALYILTGESNWQMFWNVSKPNQSTISWQDTTGRSVPDVFAALNGNCSGNSPGFRKTNEPAVAFTFDSKWVAPRLPSGVYLKYNDLVVASHSYSILGTFTFEDAYHQKYNYVVLRNPWGLPSNSITRSCCTNLFGCGGYLWKDSLPLGNGQILDLWDTGGSVNNGMFALDVLTFSRYFAGFSWV